MATGVIGQNGIFAPYHVVEAVRLVLELAVILFLLMVAITVVRVILNRIHSHAMRIYALLVLLALPPNVILKSGCVW